MPVIRESFPKDGMLGLENFQLVCYSKFNQLYRLTTIAEVAYINFNFSYSINCRIQVAQEMSVNWWLLLISKTTWANLVTEKNCSTRPVFLYITQYVQLIKSIYYRPMPIASSSCCCGV